MTQNMIQMMQITDIQVVGIRLPLGGSNSSNAAHGGKEPTRMNDRAESVHANTQSIERVSGWRKLAAVGALSVVALAGCANNVEAQPGPAESTISAEPTTPAPTDTVAEQPGATYETYTVEELQIPAGLSDEEFGRLVVEDRLAKWVNAGANEGLLTRKEEEGLTWDELLPIIADENRDLFVEALINPADGWRTGGGAGASNYLWGQHTQDSIDRLREWNLQTLQAYVETQWSDDPEDTEGYRTWWQVEGYGEVWSNGLHGYGSGDGRVDAIFTLHNNSDQNTLSAFPKDVVYHAMFQDTKVEGDQEWIQGFMISEPTPRQ